MNREALMGDLEAASAAYADPAAAADGSDDLAALRLDIELAELFISEALDHLGTIESALLALDQRPDDTALLDDIFRPFHTIKGNAAALGVTSVQEFAHRVENLLDLVRSGQHKVGPAEVDVILRAVDVAKMMIGSLALQLKGQPGTPLDDAIALLIADAERLMRCHAPVASSAPAFPGQEPGQACLPYDGNSAADRTDASAGDGTARGSIKVDARKLDDLVDSIGELITVQSLIDKDPALKGAADGRLGRHFTLLKRITADLQCHAMALRMVPIRQAFQKAARAVHDSSRRAEKSVELVLVGEDIELDRMVVELITDPLLHMVRNGVDHGIEATETRIACGKPAQGRLTLGAYQQRGRVIVEVADDGGGLQMDKILARAIARGLVPAGTLPTAQEIHRLMFAPGVTTVDQVTEMSGRGVGMDVVRRNVEALHGRIDVRSEAGRGTTFTISLPPAAGRKA